MARGSKARQRRTDQRRREAQGVKKAQALAAGAQIENDETFAEIRAIGETLTTPAGYASTEGTLAEILEIGKTLAAGEHENMGKCADCGHMADMHGGDSNDGACSADGCSCMSFDPAKDDDNDAGDEPDDDGDESAHGLVVQGESQEDLLGLTLAAAGEMAEALGQHLVFTLDGFEVEAVTADAGDGEAPIFTGGARWTANFCPEGSATEDGRIFAPGSISWRDLPLSLMGMVETQPGHDGAEICGRIDSIWRDSEASMIRASGVFDSGEYGQMIARMVGDKVLRGLSVDIAPIKVEVANRADVVDENGNWIEKPIEVSDDEEGEEAEGPSLLDILFGGEDMITVVREGVIGAATVCPFPAFAEANIEVENSLVAREQSPMVWTVTQQGGWTVVATAEKQSAEIPAEEAPLTASAAGLAPVSPPASWFDDPDLTELTPITITDDGRIFGHAASWDTCHTGIPGVCTTPPTTETDYAYFHLKEVLCEDGERVSVGTITMDAGHAELDLGRAAATDHYDNTAVAAADVRAGEDDFGIWVAGAIRPDLDEMSARRLRGATLSGDWRSVRLSDGSANRELIALLAVNVPGFPVPRPQALVASGAEGFDVVTQIAAGMHAGQEGLTQLEKRRQEAHAMEDEFAALGEALAE